MSQNVFKDAEGNLIAQRINTKDIAPTIAWLEKITGLDFSEDKDDDNVPTKWLGTTGRKPDSSGDLDLSVDDKAITKETLVGVLERWCQRAGIPQDQIHNRAKTKTAPAFLNGWIALSGDSVHFKTPINGDTKNGFVQTDFMFGDPKWQAFAMKGGRAGSPYKGMARHIILNSIVSAINPQYSWSYKNGIIDKADPKKPVTIEGGKDPKVISKLTGIPVAKLNTADDILDAISKRPDYNQLVAKARETLAYDNITLPEGSPTLGTAAWFRKMGHVL